MHITPNFLYNFFLQNHKIRLIPESFAIIQVKGKYFCLTSKSAKIWLIPESFAIILVKGKYFYLTSKSAKIWLIPESFAIIQVKGKYFHLTSKSAKIARIRAVFAKFFPPLLRFRDVISMTDLQQEAMAPSRSEFGKRKKNLAVNIVLPVAQEG